VRAVGQLAQEDVEITITGVRCDCTRQLSDCRGTYGVDRRYASYLLGDTLLHTNGYGNYLLRLQVDQAVLRDL
jgi:hypothetical protein